MAQDVKELLKDTVNIGDVVERLRLPLKRHGNCLQGDCPTGHQSTGHTCFSVNLKGNYYNCFHCKEAGDIFDLVELVHNVEFKDALKWIAQEFRPDLLPQVEKHEGKRDPKLKEYYQKADFYSVIFEYGKDLLYKQEGKEALDYLVSGRGYKEENLKKTDWIYYPPEKELRAVLEKERPESKDTIKKLRLHGYFGDHFRLAFPYRDRRGAITGFLFRATEPQGITVKTYDGVTHEGQRYDSTPDTKKYDLFNLHACKRFDELLIVEGCPDALYLPTLGLENVVAVGQGLLSKTHLEGLQAFKVRMVTLSFDNDPVKIDETGKEIHTGAENTEKAVDLLESSGITALVIDPFSLTPHKDPDEFVKAEGIEAFRKLLDNAESGVKWKAKRILSRHDTTKDRGFQDALQEIQAYQENLNPIDRDRLRTTVSVSLDIKEATLDEHFTDYNERKAREREKKAYQDLFKEGSKLLDEGKIANLRELLNERLPDLRAKGVTRDVKPYTLEDLVKDITQTGRGLKTGYESLDKLVRIPQGAITIVAGRPSHGKTTFLLNLLLKMVKADPGGHFFFFSYEESKRQVGLKLINILSGVVIRDPRQNLTQIENYLRGNNKGNSKIEDGKGLFKTFTETDRLWVIDEPYFVDDLTDTIAYLKERYGIGAVFIDYLQKVKIKGRYPTRQLELQKISERVLETAKALSLPIILGAQLGRDVGTKDTAKKVRLDNLREAGDIEQDANLVLGLYNEAMQMDEDSGEFSTENEVDLRVTILKNRNGVVNDDVTFTFNRPILTIEEKDEGHRS
ncbi:MAG: DnaB-like helicase C-terminal domain-containing protein [Syntrophorhabdales bacterium]